MGITCIQVHLLPVWTWCIWVHLLACAWCIRVYLAYVCMVCAGTLECVCMCIGERQKWLDATYDALVISTFSSSSSSSIFTTKSHWAQRLLFQCGWLARELQGSSCLQLSPQPSPRTTDESKQAHCFMWLPENQTHPRVCEAPSTLPTELSP